MSQPLKYRFTVNYNASTVVMYPDYSGNFSEELEQDQMFHRGKWNGELIFKRDEYDLIAALDIETQFTIDIEKQDNAETWFDYYSGKFTFADCEFDQDNRTVKVKPVIDDKYTDILENREKEFDLIEILDKDTRDTVLVRKTGILQIYLKGSSVINNITEDGVTEHEVFDITNNHSTLIDDYNFLSGYEYVYIPNIDGIGEDVSGIYQEIAPLQWQHITNTQYLINPAPDLLTATFTWVVRDLSHTTLQYYYKSTLPHPTTPFGTPEATGQGLLFENDAETAQLRMFLIKPYARLLTNADSIDGNDTELIPENDILDNNFNFSRCIGLTIANYQFSSNTQLTDDGVGKVVDNAANRAGEYISDIIVASWPTYPIDQSLWKEFGLFFYISTSIQDYFDESEEYLQMTHSYNLFDVIEAVVGQLDPSVTVDKTQTHSDFFFNATNPVRLGIATPLITPKSNVLAGNYDQPANKAPIKWSYIEELLKNAYQCHWHIDSGNLVVEHISFYENGHSYSGASVGNDLTTQYENQHALKQGYRLNKWKYLKDQMPERIETSWMDEVGDVFTGYAIVAESIYVAIGNTESRSISLFTSDVDHIIYNRGDISKDGFVLFEGVFNGNTYDLPYIDNIYEGETFSVQNGYAALIYLHDKYHRNFLPCSSVVLNGNSITATSTRRRKIQELELPPFGVENPHKLTRTELGDGKAKSIQTDIVTGLTKITVEHDTE